MLHFVLEVRGDSPASAEKSRHVTDLIEGVSIDTIVDGAWRKNGIHPSLVVLELVPEPLTPLQFPGIHSSFKKMSPACPCQRFSFVVALNTRSSTSNTENHEHRNDRTTTHDRIPAPFPRDQLGRIWALQGRDPAGHG